jgi:CheY-like chemotaxis protein
LGLAICKGLVELMGGMIAMQNREGGGSIFSFTIPVKTGEALRPTTTGANAGEHGLAAESVQILLVEDDPLVRDVITMGLARRGWHVETTQNGREAVEKWRRGSFDAILMDLQMPEMNGLEATRMIRSGEAVTGKHITIIGITAYVEEKALENCIKAGMDLVLSKPLHFDDLCAAINDSRTN